MLNYEQLQAIQAADGEQTFYLNLSAEMKRGYGDGNHDALYCETAAWVDEPTDEQIEQLCNVAVEKKLQQLKLTVDEALKNEYMIGYWYGQVLCG